MKKILALVLALVMVLGLTAAFADDYHFEIVSKGFQSTYWQAVLKGAQEEVDKINAEGADKITMNFVGPDSESDVAQQVQQFTSALNANPAGIGFAAVDQNAFNDLLKEALEKKIPIIGLTPVCPALPKALFTPTLPPTITLPAPLPPMACGRRSLPGSKPLPAPSASAKSTRTPPASP